MMISILLRTNGWSPLDMADYRPQLKELAKSTTREDMLAKVPASRAEELHNVETEEPVRMDPWRATGDPKTGEPRPLH
jgi:hypothetical protein